MLFNIKRIQFTENREEFYEKIKFIGIDTTCIYLCCRIKDIDRFYRRLMQKLAKLENKKREDYLRKLFYLMRLRPNIAKMLREKEKEDKMPFILDREIDPLYQEGVEKGIERGKQKAEEETKLAVAKNMLKQNLSVDTIVTVTGLSKEVVERLKKEEK